MNSYYLMFLEIDESRYLDIFKEYSDYFSNFSVIFDLLRSLGWLMLKGLVVIENQLTKVLDIVFDFLNFLESTQLEDFYISIKPFVFIVLMFGLIYLAHCFIFAHEKPKGIITNVLIFGGVMILLPFFISQLNTFVRYGKEALSISQVDSGYYLLDSYITDLLYLDSIDFDADTIKNGTTNGFDESNADDIKYLDINEVLDPGDYSLKNEKLFKKELSSSIENGRASIGVSDIKKSKFFFKDTTPYYYRYHVNFLIAMLYLLALILVLIFSTFKLIQLIYEIASEEILAPFIAAGDLANGQKIRKTLIGILNAYITIICILLLQKLFLLATTFINNNKWSDSMAMNGLAKLIMIVACSLFIIDGPNFFEQIFGIDAGLKSVGQALQSAYYGSQMAGGIMQAIKGTAGKIGNMAKAPGNMAKGAVKKTMGGAAKAAGLYSGLKDSGLFESNNEKVQKEMSINSRNQNTNSIKNNKDSDQSQKKSGENTTPLIESAGKNNLSTDNANERVNDMLNQNSSSHNGKNNLADWAKENTKAGQYLSGQYSDGKKFGHAAGNTIDNLKGNTASHPVDTINDNKDKLKG